MKANLWTMISRLEQLQDSNKRMSGTGFMNEIEQFIDHDLEKMIDGLREAQLEIEAADKQLEYVWELNKTVEQEVRKLA